jgi:hypothetical protein
MVVLWEKSPKTLDTRDKFGYVGGNIIFEGFCESFSNNSLKLSVSIGVGTIDNGGIVGASIEGRKLDSIEDFSSGVRYEG